MAFYTTKILIALCIAVPLITADGYGNENGQNNILDIETPNFFNYNSPLKQPDSLRSRPYFDFLSTLYHRDPAKSDLFRPYARTRRSAEVAPVYAVSPLELQAAVDDANTRTAERHSRHKRAIVFRPVFVYKQQQIKKQELAAKRRRRV